MSSSMSATDKSISEQNEAHKRGCLFYFKRGLLVLVIMAVGLPLFGLTYEAIMAPGDADRFPPIGQMVDVNGHRLHITCVGEGSPTVILESGAGAFSLHWSLVQPTVGSTTRTCAYDRAGLGWSELGSNPSTPESGAQELHTLLTSAGIESPYVLVGHSVGGKYIRMFTELYPDEVVGLVFVDARHESAEPVRTQEQYETDVAVYQSSLEFYRVLRRFGIARLIGVPLGRAASPSLNHLPDDVVYRMVMFSVNEETLQSLIGTHDIANDDQLRAARSLEGLPIIVLTADSSLKNTSNWEIAQQNLVALSTNSRWSVVKGTSHDIELDQPAQVTDAILDVVDAAKTGESLAQ